MVLYGGIEGGGTKFVCAVGTGPEDLRDEIRFSTKDPKETINKIIEYFKKQNEKQRLTAIGIGSFGPLDLNPNSPTYGYITTAPKAEWQNVDIYGKIKEVFKIPVGLDTDVNVAALGEYEWGAAKGLSDFIYLTIGTGIGGGGMSQGNLLHGLLHPEMGHIYIPHNHKKDPYKGMCPFHKDCLEGLASGPAIKDRWGKPGEELEESHPAWELEATYISYAIVNYICVLSPQRVILGGGVMKKRNLLKLIQKKVKDLLNNYIRVPEITKKIEKYIVLSELGDRAGVLGAIALAKRKEKE
ncbi:MAG: ROK family protein [candidate division WOR-3 bacterium]